MSWRYIFRLTFSKILKYKKYCCDFLPSSGKKSAAIPASRLNQGFPKKYPALWRRMFEVI